MKNKTKKIGGLQHQIPSISVTIWGGFLNLTLCFKELKTRSKIVNNSCYNFKTLVMILFRSTYTKRRNDNLMVIITIAGLYIHIP